MAPSESDLVGLSANLGLIDLAYARYLENKEGIDESWRRFFQTGIVPKHSRVNGAAAQAGGQDGAVQALINAYRVGGHLAADVDPLDMQKRQRHPELDPETYGLGDEVASLVERLRKAYAGTIGIEFMHISHAGKRNWLAERMEAMPDAKPLDPALRRNMLRRIISASTFEHFVHTKFPGTKRFSLEGGETLIPVLDETIEHAARLGAIEIVLGMAHRGRLNVLTHVMGKRPRDLFTEFEDIQGEATQGGGDVKYHLGYSVDRVTRCNQTVHMSLAFNPSHLEAVDPVVCGRVRAKQRRHGDWERRRTVGVLVHGDAAFAGQGLVTETLQLSNLHGYRTGGTVHIVVNNQIGFTATPSEARSTPYATDVAKMIECPIWHVNGEDPDACARVIALALEYRAQFASDVVIDMFCYRKYGHNEMDEPSFTQPEMYRRIQSKSSIGDIYGERLIEEGVLQPGDVERLRAEIDKGLDTELSESKSAAKRPIISAMAGIWQPYRGGADKLVPEVDTGVPAERLAQITDSMATVPSDFTVNPKVKRLLLQRSEMGHGQRAIDWGMGEMLAYGSILWDGMMVRLSGQDSARGTFSHRHAIIVDQNSGTEYMLLGHLHPEQGECRIYDSPLSEAAVLGFEFGYSLDYPDGLIIWEAQFGDFANGAQVILDQFVASSEDKWNRLSGLTMLLPHGYEGQGPEHSSARIERFLQMAAEDNMQICQPTTPAQMFHLLRRQVMRPYRKPLVVFTPKSLLRLPEAASQLSEITSGRFQRILLDPEPPKAPTRLFLCSGRIYYDLVSERRERGDKDTAIVRIEQFYPWQPELVEDVLKAYPTLTELVWVQDEPDNMGALTWMAPRLQKIAGKRMVRLVGRAESASPATGSARAHAMEQKDLLNRAFAR
jgi:2-oxoglutarate dehydrogenase E1 component